MQVARRLPVATSRRCGHSRRLFIAQPFRPFDLVLADGNTYTITHPDFLAIPPGPISFDIVFWTELGRGDFHTHWFHFNLVQELVVPTGSVSRPAARTEGNGA